MFKARGPTRRHLLQAGAAMGGATLTGRTVWAQAKAAPTKVLDFQTYADMAKVEQEGEFVFYCHENEAGTAAIVDAFTKDFPKIQGSYVRAQTGALYSKILAERSAGRFDVRRDPALRPRPGDRFPEEGRLRNLPFAGSRTPTRRNTSAIRPGAYFWTGVDFTGICYCTVARAGGRDAPKNWKDLLDPRWRGAMSCKIAASGLQFVQWYELRKLYGDALLEELRQAEPARLRQPRAADGPPGTRRRQGDVCRRIRGLCAVSEEGRRYRLRRPAGRAAGDAAGGRRGEPRAASRNRQAVRRLGDVAARPEVLPGQPEPDLRLGARRRAADADRRCA